MSNQQSGSNRPAVSKGSGGKSANKPKGSGKGRTITPRTSIAEASAAAGPKPPANESASTPAPAPAPPSPPASSATAPVTKPAPVVPPSSATAPVPQATAATQTAVKEAPLPVAPPRPAAGPAPMVTPRAAKQEKSAKGKPTKGGPRQVKLTLSRINPASVFKFGLLYSTGFAIGQTVAILLVWVALNSRNVFGSMDQLIAEVTGGEMSVQIMDYLQFSNVLSFAIVVGLLDIVLFTVLGLLGAILYNVVSQIVGGIHLTLTDD